MALLTGLDLADEGDAVDLATHRRNLFALAPGLDPVVAAILTSMVETDRRRRLADLPDAITRLLSYRDQPEDFDLDRVLTRGSRDRRESRALPPARATLRPQPTQPAAALPALGPHPRPDPGLGAPGPRRALDPPRVALHLGRPDLAQAARRREHRPRSRHPLGGRAVRRVDARLDRRDRPPRPGGVRPGPAAPGGGLPALARRPRRPRRHDHLTPGAGPRRRQQASRRPPLPPPAPA